jgi:hypothetical protein
MMRTAAWIVPGAVTAARNQYGAPTRRRRTIVPELPRQHPHGHQLGHELPPRVLGPLVYGD